QVQAAFGRFDPTLSLSTRYSYTNTPQNAAQYIATGGTVTQTQLSLLEQLEELLAILRGQERPQPSPNQRILLQPNLYDSQNFFNRISLSGLFPLGTSYEFYLNFDELRNETNIRGLPALFYPEYSGAVGFRLSQPLLRNFGPAANLAPVALARLDRHIGWLEWRAEVERVLADVAAAYIDLALANENLLVRSDNIRLAQRLAYENQRRVLHGRMSQFDVLEALSAVKSREDDFYTASSELATRMSTFRSLVSSPNSLQQWTDLRPADPIPYFPFTPNRDESRFIAFQHNPQLLIARTYIEKSDVTILYYRNQTLPDLSIQLGLAGLSTSSSYPNSIEDSFSGQGTDFSAAVVLSIPLGNVQARAQL
ncbi:MAG: TolC family protein, partial [Chthoniobacterales bacterium]|nr:TolC family protein [Chthoniobacterales bacterium]